jgi:hypothetical protein
MSKVLTKMKRLHGGDYFFVVGKFISRSFGGQEMNFLTTTFQ